MGVGRATRCAACPDSSSRLDDFPLQDRDGREPCRLAALPSRSAAQMAQDHLPAVVLDHDGPSEVVVPAYVVEQGFIECM